MKKFILVCFGAFLLVAVGGAIGAVVAIQRAGPSSPPETGDVEIPSTDSLAASSKVTLFATMLGLNSSNGYRSDRSMESLAETSWKTLAQSSSYPKFLSTLEAALAQNARLIAQTGFSSNRDVIGPFVWNVVQTDPGGAYDWSIADRVMAAAGEAQITESAVVYPYAAWDATETVPEERCVGIDFTYYDYRGGLPRDWDAYARFLTAAVERYDGDGVDDMPGLATRVEAWEIANEVEGPCGAALSDATNYAKLVKFSAPVIHAADPDALVSNGGALEVVDGNGSAIPETEAFWRTFFAEGGADVLDVLNIHYNREREGADDTADVWQRHLDFFSGLLAERGLDLPIWVGEFGTYVGAPEARTPPPPPDGAPVLAVPTPPVQSAAFQASWYFRYAVMGFDAGVRRYFVDLKGQDNTGVGGSALFSQTDAPRPFLSTLQLLGGILEGFTSVEKVADGQYRFETPTDTVYALWSGTLPEGAANGIALDMTGSEVSAGDLANLSVAFTEADPILVVVRK